MSTLNENHTNVAPMIWQTDTDNASPNAIQRMTTVADPNDGIPQAAFQGLVLEIGAATDAYNAQYLAIYQEIVKYIAPVEISVEAIADNNQLNITGNYLFNQDIDLDNVELVYVITNRLSADYFCSVVAYEHEAIASDIALNTEYDINKTINLNSSWNLDDIKCWVMVQTMGTGAGNSEIYNAREAAITTAGENNDVPQLVTALNGNYPNPFNPETTISFSNEKTGHVSLDIYNIKGQKVNTLVNTTMEAGMHTVVWNGKDNQGSQVASGIYFYRMKNGSYSSTKKMILMK